MSEKEVIDKSLRGITCKDCIGILQLERPEFVYKTELCALHIDPEWSEEIVLAIDLLKRNKITDKKYSQTRISCKIKNKSKE